MEKLIRVILSVFFGLLSAAALSAQESRPPSAASESALPSLDAIKSCNNQPNGPECLDMLFRDALKKTRLSKSFN